MLKELKLSFYNARFFFILIVVSSFPHSFLAQNYLPDVSVLVNKTHAERTLILAPFYEYGIRYSDSITIFKKINKLQHLAQKKGDRDLYLEGELMKIHYYHYRDFCYNDFVVDKMKALETITDQENVLWLKIRIQSLLGNHYYFNHGNYAVGIKYFERTLDLLETVSIKDFPLKQICFYASGRVYYEFKEYKAAIKVFRKALQMKSQLNNDYYKFQIGNTLGLAYQKTKRIDSSDYYFKQTLDYAKIVNNKAWEGISSGNLGYNYFLKGHNNKAISLIKKDIDLALFYKDWGLAGGAYCNLAEVYLRLKNYDEAETNIKNGIFYAQKANRYSLYPRLYEFQSMVLKQKNKHNLAMEYLEASYKARDSIAKVFDDKKLLRAQQELEIQQQKAKANLEQQESKSKLLKRNTLIALLAMLFLVMALIYNRRLLKAKHKEQKIHAEKELAFQKLESAKAQLKNFKQSIVEKNQIIENLETNEHTSDPKTNPPSEHLKIENQLKETAILTDDDWKIFTRLFREVYPKFFGNLGSRFPKATPSEIRLLALSKLKLNTKEIALTLGIGESAVRQTKSRFRKKYGLQNHSDLDDLIARL